MEQDKEVERLVKYAYGVMKLSLLAVTLVFASMTFVAVYPDALTMSPTVEPVVSTPTDEERDAIENGIHLRTGLIDADGMYVVIGNCTNCHSARLITQNRMTAERWHETIDWMQETQNLWDLGENEEVIVNYLVTNYPPKESNGRRSQLTDIDWYELED